MRRFDSHTKAYVVGVVRWRSKVAENEAMISPDLKNIFSKKNLIGKIFLELEKVGDPSILVGFGRNPFVFRAREKNSDEIFFEKIFFKSGLIIASFSATLDLQRTTLAT